jgi:hypothetical protein
MPKKHRSATNMVLAGFQNEKVSDEQRTMNQEQWKERQKLRNAGTPNQPS